MLPNALNYNAPDVSNDNVNTASTELDWNDEISGESSATSTLIDGEYNFTVKNMRRERFNGSDKLDPCNKAVLTLEVETEKGNVNVTTDLMLSKRLEFKLVQFFTSIGQMKPGEKMRMNWNAVVGSKGRALFKPRTFTNRFGTDTTVNAVEKYIAS